MYLRNLMAMDTEEMIRAQPMDAAIVIGDARLQLASQPPGRFDILVIDAFSSDAIPLHLLTSEAIGIYARAMKPDGVLLIHISNRFFALEPVLAAEAKARKKREKRKRQQEKKRALAAQQTQRLSQRPGRAS